MLVPRILEVDASAVGVTLLAWKEVRNWPKFLDGDGTWQYEELREEIKSLLYAPYDPKAPCSRKQLLHLYKH